MGSGSILLSFGIWNFLRAFLTVVSICIFIFFWLHSTSKNYYNNKLYIFNLIIIIIIIIIITCIIIIIITIITIITLLYFKCSENVWNVTIFLWNSFLTFFPNLLFFGLFSALLLRSLFSYTYVACVTN